MHNHIPLILVILLVFIIDLAVRFGTSFDVDWVIKAETVLFLLGSIAIFILYKQVPEEFINRRRTYYILALSFALASIRSAIWASGQPVYVANLIILLLGAVTFFVFIIRKRRRIRSK